MYYINDSNFAKSAPIRTNEWHFCVMTVKPKKFARYFLDGKLIGYHTERPPQVSAFPNKDCYFGATDGRLHHFKGLIGRVSFWEKAFDPNEIDRPFLTTILLLGPAILKPSAAFTKVEWYRI